MKEQLASLFEYGEWVNQRLLEAASPLTDEQFTQKSLSGFGSVHLTFVHVLGAEAMWFARWQGLSPKSMLAAQDLPNARALHERWATLIDERRAYFAAVGENDLGASVSWTNMRGQSFALPRWQVILHCANHSTHHHSELATMLTALGHAPNSTELLEFYLERGGQQWKPSNTQPH